MKTAASLIALGILSFSAPAMAAPAGLSEECQELYDAYQDADSPKAFAVGPGEACGFNFDVTKSLEYVRQEAIATCEEHSASKCDVVEQDPKQ